MSGLNDRQLLDATFRRLARVKQPPPRPADALGPEMVAFFKDSVQKRQTKFAKVADAWGRLVPPSLNEHCALESLSRGTLTVLVDTSSHLYDIKQLLLAGLQQQLTLSCASAGLKKVSLKPGRWYDDSQGDRKVKFG
jgi:hypothetical protein